MNIIGKELSNNLRIDEKIEEDVSFSFEEETRYGIKRELKKVKSGG